jgi:hypothetical protein
MISHLTCASQKSIWVLQVIFNPLASLPIFVSMHWIRCFLFVLFSFIGLEMFGQDVTDSVAPAPKQIDTVRKRAVPKPVIRRRDTTQTLRRDTTRLVRDSVVVKPVPAHTFNARILGTLIYTKHPYFRFTDPIRFTTSERKWEGMEAVFYAIIGLLIFFAIIRNAFSKYLNDLFRLYFRATLKSRQIREQLMQSPMPSLLLNILFFISAGLFISLIFKHYNWGSGYGFWMLWVYSVTALLIIYLAKFLVLKICGWIFRVNEAADAYIFIVFANNKIVGILLLPFILFLAFTKGVTYEIAFALAISVVVGLYAYRYFVAFATIQRQLRINFFHFLVYLIAFEIAPLLLINKLLLKYIIERA